MRIAPLAAEPTFTYAIYAIHEGAALIAEAPVVDGWLQLSVAAIAEPPPAERAAFFAALGELAAELRDLGGLDAWYFLRKSPGLRLRVHLAGPPEPVIGCILAHLDRWPFAFLGQAWFDGFIEQRNLLGPLHDRGAAALLTDAADACVAAGAEGRTADAALWAEATVHWLGHLLDGDLWWVDEVLRRLQHLRARPIARSGAPSATAPAPIHPGQLLTAVPPRPDLPGFEASTGLLAVLTQIYNLFGLDLACQQQTLHLARERVRPSLP